MTTQRIEYKKVVYIGTHPWIKNKVGISCWSDEQRSWMFLPYITEERDDWYRIHPRNLQPVVEVADEE